MEYQDLTDDQKKRAVALLEYLNSTEFEIDMLEGEFAEYLEETGWLEDE